MNLTAAVAFGLAGYAAWDLRRRWMPPELLQLIGEGEPDNAPDLVDQATALSSQIEGSFMPADIPADAAAANVAAFSNAVKWSEGTARYPDPYRVLFGGGTFDSFADHPANLGWPGVRLSDAQCRGAGFGPGCVSTAAGAHQWVRPTWNRLAKRLQLPDFGPDSQEAAFVAILDEQGALGDVQAGRFDLAVSKVRRIWASLPGAGYGQGERSLAQLRSAYVNAGGTLQA